MHAFLVSDCLNALLISISLSISSLIALLKDLKLHQGPLFPQLYLLNVLEISSMNNLLPSYLFLDNVGNRNLSSKAFKASGYKYKVFIYILYI